METGLKINPETLREYQNKLNAQLKPASLKRKLSSLRQFSQWAENEGYLAKTSSVPRKLPAHLGKAIFGAVIILFIFTLSRFISIPTSIKIPASKIPVLKVTEPQTIIAGSLPWIIRFQGKLSSTNGQPIRESAKVVFKLYKEEKDGPPLWTSKTWPLEPNPQGEFTAPLGDTTRGDYQLPSNYFFQEKELFLEVEVNGEQILERMRVSTADAAANSYLLQNYAPDLEAGPLTIPVINEDGALVLAAQNPSIKAVSGTLGISADSLSLFTPDASDGSITLNPDGKGVVNLLFEGKAPLGGDGFLNAKNANQTSGALIYGEVANNANGYRLIELVSGSTPTTRFSVDAQGNTFVAGQLKAQSGQLTNDLNLVSGNLKTSGVIRFTNAGRLASITGYYQDSGEFRIDQGGPDIAKITKSGVTASADSLTITMDETNQTTSNYDTLVLSRVGGGSEAYALYVKEGKAKFAGNLRVEKGLTAAEDLTVDQTATVYGPLLVGSSSQFKVDTSGNITKIKNLTYSWPSSHTTNGVLINDGGGTLTWSTIGGSSITPDSLDFTEFQDAMTLDANLTISPSASNYSINIDSGSLFVDTANNRVGIGTASPNNLIQVADLINFNNTDFNTALGYQSGKNIVSGAQYNTFLGYQAGYYGTASTNAADYNTAIGYQALFSNTDGDNNTALGNSALYSNTTGFENTALGNSALYSNTTGYYNTALGMRALFSNTDGTSNIALGYQALRYNTTGTSNIALGYSALYLSTGTGNLAFGYQAGDNITSGSRNIIIGYDIEAPSATGNDQLSIGNLIFATGMDGTGTTISSGNVGIGTTSPNNRLDVLSTTTPQLRVAYDTSNYLTVATSIAGAVTFDSTGTSPSFTISDNLTASGTLTVSGLAAFNGSVDLGDAASDTITFTGVVDSNIIADANNTRNLGSSSVRWATGYFVDVNATNIIGTIVGGSTNASTWTINADNATNNAEIAALAFETGTATFNSVMQWNAAGDAGRVVGFDSYNLFNFPVGIYSQVSGINTTFTGGSIIKYGQPTVHAITQASAFIGLDFDLSTNITVPNSSSGNQTGVKTTLKDGGASATAIGFQTAGTLDYGLDIGGTVGTADIRLSNAETISNTTDGTISMNPTTFTLSGTTTLTASSLSTLTTAATLSMASTTTLNCSDCIDFDDLEDTLDLDAATDINLGVNQLSIDLDSTGDFVVRDVTTAFATFADDSSITFAATNQSVASGASAEFTTLTLTPPTITLTGTTQVTSQMDSILLNRPTIAGDTATVTVDDAATLTLAGPPAEGTNVSLTEAYGLKINTAATTATTAYGLFVDAPTGATNNYAAIFNTGNVGIGTTNPSALLSVGSTSQFQVSSTGAVTAVGVNSGSGLIQGTGGLTVTGTTNINATGTSATNIGNSTGALTLASGGTSAWTNTSGNLTLSTATSGTLALTSAGALNLSAGSASTWTLPAVANALNIDANTLTIDALNDRVGIGTTAPGAHLEIFKSTPELRLTDTTSNDYARITKANTLNKLSLFNRISVSSDSYTKLLLHTDGTNGSTSFPDDAGKTVTANGNAQVSTAQYKFGTGSLLLDGNGDYLSTPDHDDWNFGTGDFTIDAWVRFTTLSPSYQLIINQEVNGDNRWLLFYDASLGLRFYSTYNGVNAINVSQGSTSGWSTNTWYHVAIIRSGNNFTLTRDGASIATLTSSNAITDLAGPLEIGQETFNNSNYFNGYIDEIRVSKGVARWTSFPFTPSTSAYSMTGIQEATVMTSEDGVDVSEVGIHTFGDSSGRTVLQGTTQRFFIGSNEKMRLDASGNLGIGTTNPSALLSVGSTSQFQVNSSGNVTFASTLTPTANFTLGSASYTGAITTSDWAVSSTGAMTKIDSLANTSADLALLTTTSGNISLTPAATTGLVNILTGNLKVGNGSPTQTQDGEDVYVEGMLEIDGTTYLDGAVNLGGTTTWTLAAGGQLVIDAATNDNTTTTGVINFDIDSATTDNIGLSLDYQSLAGAAALTQYASKIDVTIDANATYDNTVFGQYIGMTQNDTGATAWGLYVTGEDKNYFSGNVGIGTTGPQRLLHLTGAGQDVSGNNQYGGMLSIMSNDAQAINTGGSISFGGKYTDTGDYYTWTAIRGLKSNSTSGNADGHLAFYTRGGGQVTTERMRITDAGNVGIGTTGPDSKVQISGGGLCVGSDANCNTDNNTEGYVYAAQTAMIVYDVAENYPTKDETLGAGEVVSLDSNNAVFVKRSSLAYDSNLLGIISTEPAVLLGGFKTEKTQFPDEIQVPVALSGRVPVKVSTENGPIAIGDPLTSSSIPGVAMRATKAGAIVGKALEPLPASPSLTWQGKILAFVNVSWYDPDVYLTDSGNLRITSDTQYAISDTNNQSTSPISPITYHLLSAAGKQIDRIGAFAKLAVANLKAGLIQTQDLIAEKKIVSPVVETDEIGIRNQELGIKNKDGEMVMKIDNEGKTTHFGDLLIHDSSFIIQNSSGSAVASIDETGSASFSGQLTADSLQLENDATISGTLYADEIITRKGTFGELLAASVSAETIAQADLGKIEKRLRELESSSQLTPTPTPDLSTPEATDSALLTDVPNWQLTDPSGDLKITSDVRITGKTNLAQTIVAGPLSQDGSLIIDQGNSINVTTGTLYLQNLGFGGVDILAGKVVIDVEGNVQIAGNLAVGGEISASKLVLTRTDLAGGPSSSGSGFGQLLEVKNSTGEVLASIDASGSASFAQVETKKIVIASAESPIPNSQFPITEIQTNATAGEAILPAGETEFTIFSPKVNDNTLIYITPVSNTQNKVLYVSAKKAEEFFKVAIDTPINQDIQFNWWIIN